ncbi:MAG: hypothetical protein K0R15_2881 [Clostridiales bacterium]|nr:hypothetical protein [Clostridiales bacterium]
MHLSSRQGAYQNLGCGFLTLLDFTMVVTLRTKVTANPLPKCFYKTRATYYLKGDSQFVDISSFIIIRRYHCRKYIVRIHIPSIAIIVLHFNEYYAYYSVLWFFSQIHCYFIIKSYFVTRIKNDFSYTLIKI